MPALLDALKSENSDTRHVAMEELAATKDARAAGPIAARLGNAFDRTAAVSALRKMGSMAEKDVIVWMGSTDISTVKAACEVLRSIGTIESVPGLNLAARRGGLFIQREAADALIAVAARLTPEEKAKLTAKPKKK